MSICRRSVSVASEYVALVEWNDQALDECFGQRGGGRGRRAAPDGGEQREVDPDPDAGADLQELDRVARHRANFASDHLGDVLRDLEACDLHLGPRPGVSIGIEVDDSFRARAERGAVRRKMDCPPSSRAHGWRAAAPVPVMRRGHRRGARSAHRCRAGLARSRAPVSCPRLRCARASAARGDQRAPRCRGTSRSASDCCSRGQRRVSRAAPSDELSAHCRSSRKIASGRPWPAIARAKRANVAWSR